MLSCFVERPITCRQDECVINNTLHSNDTIEIEFKLTKHLSIVACWLVYWIELLEGLWPSKKKNLIYVLFFLLSQDIKQNNFTSVQFCDVRSICYEKLNSTHNCSCHIWGLMFVKHTHMKEGNIILCMCKNISKGRDNRTCSW